MDADQTVLAARINAEQAKPEDRPKALRARAFAEAKRFALTARGYEGDTSPSRPSFTRR